MRNRSEGKNIESYYIRHVADESELAWMYRLQQSEYGADNIVSFDTVRAWYKKFGRAGYRLHMGDECLGGIGLWPLKPETFDALVNGQRDEHQMTVDDIEADAPRRQFRYWYFADIFLVPDYRLAKDRWAARLLIATMEKWLTSDDPAEEVSVCALVYSAQGKSIARRLGLEPCATTPDGYNVYMRTVTRVQFLTEIEKLKQRFQKWL